MWPKQVAEFYKPVKRLGKGGFGDVWLGETVYGASAEKLDNLVAIKKVDTSTKVGEAYAAREITVLKELHHPNIVKLIKVFDSEKDDPSLTCSFIALSFAKGPTLEQVLKEGGAVGIPFARILSQQLVSTVAYLHNHALIHRDIKPDNIIITGAALQDDDLWDDGTKGEAAAYKKKWHIILIDFGFVRALCEEDIKTDVALYNIVKQQDIEHMAEVGKQNSTLNNEIVNSAMSLQGTESDRGRQKDRIDVSISHARVRDLSAVGNRNYAAPEIINGVHEKKDNSLRGRKRRQSLTDFVSNYGMDADAFSLGMVLRYALTGVPPGNDVRDYIAMKNNKFLKVLITIGKKIKKKNGKNVKGKRKKKYRPSQACPKEATKLIVGLTLWNAAKRTTVRAAQFHPWLLENDDSKKLEDKQWSPVTFLSVEV